jgi:hypothetical protein
MLYSVNELGQLYLNCKLDVSQKKEAGGLRWVYVEEIKKS